MNFETNYSSKDPKDRDEAAEDNDFGGFADNDDPIDKAEAPDPEED